MSQEKVDRRKAYKKNRKQILAREKRAGMISRFLAYLCLLALLCGVGFSVYKKINPTPEPDENTFYALTATDSYRILTPSLPDSK